MMRLFSKEKYATQRDFIDLAERVERYARYFSRRYHISMERIFKEIGFPFEKEFDEILERYYGKVTKKDLKAYEIFSKLKMEYLPAKEEDIKRFEEKIYSFLRKNNLVSRRDICEIVKEYISELRNLARSGILHQEDILFLEMTLESELLKIKRGRSRKLEKADRPRLRKALALSCISLITLYPMIHAYSFSETKKVDWKKSLKKKIVSEDLGERPLPKEEQKAVLKHFAPVKQLDKDLYKLIEMIVSGKAWRRGYPSKESLECAEKVAEKHRKMLLNIYNSTYKREWEKWVERSKLAENHPEKLITIDDPVIINFTIDILKKDRLRKYLRTIGVDVPNTIEEKHKLKEIAEKDSEFRVLRTIYDYVEKNFAFKDDAFCMYLPAWVHFHEFTDYIFTSKKVFKDILKFKLPKYYELTEYTDFFKYPHEFLKDKGGDCDDYAIFFATISKILGYNSYVGANKLYTHFFCVIELKGKYYVIDPIYNAFMVELEKYTKHAFGKKLKFQEVILFNDVTSYRRFNSSYFLIEMPPTFYNLMRDINTTNIMNQMLYMVGCYLVWKEHLEKLEKAKLPEILMKEREVAFKTFIKDLHRELLARGIKDIPKYVGILKRTKDFKSYIKEVSSVRHERANIS